MQYGSQPHGGNLGAWLLNLPFLVSVLSKVLYGLSAQFRQAFNAVLPELQHSQCSFAAASTQFSRGFNTVFTSPSTMFWWGFNIVLPGLQRSFARASTQIIYQGSGHDVARALDTVGLGLSAESCRSFQQTVALVSGNFYHGPSLSCLINKNYT